MARREPVRRRSRPPRPTRPRVLAELPDGTVATYGDDVRAGGPLRPRPPAGRGRSRATGSPCRSRSRGRRVVLYLGCLRAGAVYLPLNPAYTPAEVDYFLRDAEPVVFVCSPSRRDDLARGRRRRPAWRRLETMGARGRGLAPGRRPTRRRPSASTSSVAAATWPPSSTRRARPGARRAPCSRTTTCAPTRWRCVDCWRFTADDVLVHALPIFHTHGLFVATNVVLLAGGVDDLPAHLRRGAGARRARRRATALMGVPTFYTRLLAAAAA